MDPLEDAEPAAPSVPSDRAPVPEPARLSVGAGTGDWDGAGMGGAGSAATAGLGVLGGTAADGGRGDDATRTGAPRDGVGWDDRAPADPMGRTLGCAGGRSICVAGVVAAVSPSDGVDVGADALLASVRSRDSNESADALRLVRSQAVLANAARSGRARYTNARTLKKDDSCGMGRPILAKECGLRE